MRSIAQASSHMADIIGVIEGYPSAQPVLSVRVHDAKVSASW
jgi:hypothetical protein